MVKKKKTDSIKKMRQGVTKASSVERKGAASKKDVKKKNVVPKAVKKTSASTIKKTSKNSSATEVKVKTNKKQLNKNLSPREEKIQHIKARLLQQRAALLNEAESALNELPGQTIFPDLGDQATAETDRNFMLRLRGREQRLLKKIDEAVSRIDSGSFGICDDCGNEIDIKRLEARPVTTMCIECKTLQEEEEKLRES
jgi:DnaK suppressor protein